MATAYITEAVRTAGGRRKGALADWHPADLGAEIINALLRKSRVDPKAVNDVIVGCVTQAGEQAFAFGRNCVLASDLPTTTPAVTIDRQCGSSQQSVQFAAQAVMSGTQDMVIAMGVESMSRVPMFSNMTLHDKASIGTGPFSRRIRDRFGVDSFSQFRGAEMIARKYGFTREELDFFALESHVKSRTATQNGVFQNEIIPVSIGETSHKHDEGIRFDASIEGISGVDPLEEGGVITAANASQICDGASGVLIVNEKALKAHNLTPIARIVNLTVTAGDPVIMLEEPIRATQTSLANSGMKLDDIDLFEVNEAFAPIPMAWQKTLDADPDKLNVNGGAIALGHPLGASGTRLMSTLIYALKARGKTYGLQTMCEGGGIANVTILETL